MEIDIRRVIYDDIKLKTRDAEKIRGYIGNKYIENSLLHNHDDKKYIYRYPLVQYKVLNGIPIIIGIGEGAESISKIGILNDEFIINNKKYITFQKQIIKVVSEIASTDDYIEYELLTPWIALNQKNIFDYINGNLIEKEEILKKILIGNIISMSKGLNYTVDKQIFCWVNLKEVSVNLKGKKHIAFVGRFKVNFNIPDYLGIGKSVSRGFGTVKKYSTIKY